MSGSPGTTSLTLSSTKTRESCLCAQPATQRECNDIYLIPLEDWRLTVYPFWDLVIAPVIESAGSEEDRRDRRVAG